MFSLISCCERLTTPTKPSLSGYTRPFRISSAFVPASIKSSFVSTPIVRRPLGSILRASRRESELARSTLAGEIARMMLYGESGYSMYAWNIAAS